MYLVENLLISLIFVSSWFIIMVNNPIQSLLWLVLVFALSSMLFMFLGCEYMSLLIFMIYIAAIAVLLLFVIMMLDIKIVELRSLYLRYLPIGSFVILFFFFELLLSFFLYFNLSYYYLDIYYINWINFLNFKGNIYLIGYVIYVTYSPFFLILALILFVSMFGSIILIIHWIKRVNTTKIYNDVFFLIKKKSNF